MPSKLLPRFKLSLLRPLRKLPLLRLRELPNQQFTTQSRLLPKPLKPERVFTTSSKLPIKR